MSETILWESETPTKSVKIINEEGPEANNGGTTTSDIAQTDPKLAFAKPVTSQSIPEMIGYNQQMNAPQGFVFGLTSRSKTSIANIPYPASPVAPASPDTPEDLIITRKSVNTAIRSIAVSTTNEVEQDIMSLFGNDFARMYGNYLSSGEVESNQVAQYFLDYGEWKLNQKINDDFMTWIETEASDKGTLAIATIDDMPRIFQAFGELREALYKSSGKSGRTWCIVSPRIASFLTSTVGAVSANRAEWFENGRKIPNNKINAYVCTLGDMDVYQYNFLDDVVGGTGLTTEATGEIYMGIEGGPNSSSIYYNKYKKYIVKGGSDAYTGQSTVWYKVRDDWSTNPQDTYDSSTAITDVSALEGTNSSSYLVYANVTFGESVLS